MRSIPNQSATGQLTQEEIQGLIATSTGVIEAYVIPVNDDVPILLPQNMILSAMNVSADVKKVEWHEKYLPAYAVHQPDLDEVTALVIDGETEEKRFALLCDRMPETLRLRISEVIDLDKETSNGVYQYVTVNGQEYQIPNLHNIQAYLFAE